MRDADPGQDEFLDAIGRLGTPLLQLLDALESVARRLHPPRIPELRARVAPFVQRLDAARVEFTQAAPPAGLEPLAAAFGEAAAAAARAGHLFVDGRAGERADERADTGAEDAPGTRARGEDAPDAHLRAGGDTGAFTGTVAQVLSAMKAHAEAQALLLPMADFLPPVHRFFLEPPLRELRPLPTPAPGSPPGPPVPSGQDRRLGLFRATNGSDEHGGFTLYVPNEYDPSEPWPLVVALHGGSGQGSQFLFTWLREARSRGFLLLAPTSLRSTWSLGPENEDGPNLRRQLDWVAERWSVDPGRVLLTGLSDGATYTLLEGLSEGSPFTALAPVSGVFHPIHFVNGNLDRAAGRRIHLVHGALDWMFPVETAREAARVLEGAGADLVYREIGDLSHSYPREVNDAILTWLDPRLALPRAPGAGVVDAADTVGEIDGADEANGSQDPA